MTYIYLVDKPFYIAKSKIRYKKDDVILTYDNLQEKNKILIYKAIPQVERDYFPIAKAIDSISSLIPRIVIESCCHRVTTIEDAFFTNLKGINKSSEVPKFDRKINSGIRSTSKEVENYMNQK